MLSVLKLNDILEIGEELLERRQYRDLLTHMQQLPGDIIEHDATAAYLLAYGMYMTGHEAAAAKVLDRTSLEGRSFQNNRIRRRITNLTAIIKIERGDLTEGEGLLDELSILAEAANDQKYVAFSTLNRGVSAQMRGAVSEAIAALQRASTAFQRLGDLASTAGCSHNLGICYRDLGHYASSERHFQAAREYFADRGSPEELVTTDLERSTLVALASDTTLASGAASRALKAAKELENPRLCAEAERAFGFVLLTAGNLPEAREHLSTAFNFAKSSGIMLLAAESQHLLALVNRESGDAGGALRQLDEATMTYQKMGASIRVRRLTELANRWRSGSADGTN